MNFLVRFFTFFSRYTRHLGICGNVGLISGAISGFWLTLLDIMQNGLVLTNQHALYIALILTGFTWLIVLFILFVFGKFTLRSIAMAALINCFLTSLATVFLTKYLNVYPLAWFIGIIAGILVGVILCRVNALFQKLSN